MSIHNELALFPQRGPADIGAIYLVFRQIIVVKPHFKNTVRNRHSAVQIFDEAKHGGHIYDIFIRTVRKGSASKEKRSQHGVQAGRIMEFSYQGLEKCVLFG